MPLKDKKLQLAYAKKCYKEHKKEPAPRNKKYHEESIEEILAKAEKKRMGHLASCKKYSEKNKEKIAANAKKNRKEHPEYYKKRYEEHREEISTKTKKKRKEMSSKERELMLTKKKKYYDGHKEEISAKAKKRRKDHPEIFSEKYRKYREKNPDNGKKYYAEHKEKIADQAKKRRAAHPEIFSEKRHKYREKNLDKIKSQFRESIIKKYGLKKEDYDKMNFQQKGRCAICGKVNTRKGETIALGIDHNHKTGKIRKLLCNRCNVLLGMIHENVSLLAKIQKYLSKNKNIKEE